MSLRACDFFLWQFGAPRIEKKNKERVLVIPCLFVVYRWTAHPNVAGRPVPEHTVYVSVARLRSLFHLRAFPCVFVVVGTEERKTVSRSFDLCASGNTGEDKEPLESSRVSEKRLQDAHG